MKKPFTLEMTFFSALTDGPNALLIPEEPVKFVNNEYDRFFSFGRCQLTRKINDCVDVGTWCVQVSLCDNGQIDVGF